jgi:serine/threonine protein kinase
MHLKERVKEKFVMRCISCGHASDKGVTGSLTGWLFHEQICSCKEKPSNEQMPIGSTSECTPALERNGSEDVIDLGELYEIIGVIGKGGMGTVYKARDKEDEKIVAIKVLKQELVSNPAISKRFEQEALAVSRLNHPNLIAVQGSGKSPSGAPYIVMEYFAGKTLADLIKARGHLSVTEAIQITMQIAEAIEHAHAFSVIHRDIKPSNILLSQDGEHVIVKVVDFGIAKAMSDESVKSAQLTQTGEIFGSPTYMSPEQCLGENIDERSDIYSLGCVMYEMLTGKSPFLASNPIQTILRHLEKEPEPFDIEFSNLKIPKLISTTVFKCLQKEPDKRYATVLALKKDLQDFGTNPGAFTRLVAAALDLFFFLIPASLFCFACENPLWRMTDWNLPVSIWCFIGLMTAYFAILETSPSQATPGMLICGLSVTDRRGQRLGLLISAIRVLSLIGVLTIVFHAYRLIELSMILLGIRHAYVHPDWAFNIAQPTLVIPVIILCLVYWLLIAFSKNHISPIDGIFDRIVAYRNVSNHSNVTASNQNSSRAPTKTQWLIGLAAVASIYFVPWLSDRLADRANAKQWPAVYAIEDINEGSPILPEMLEVRMISNDDSNDNTVQSISAVKGKVYEVPIYQGDMLLTSRLESSIPPTNP